MLVDSSPKLQLVTRQPRNRALYYKGEFPVIYMKAERSQQSAPVCVYDYGKGGLGVLLELDQAALFEEGQRVQLSVECDYHVCSFGVILYKKQLNIHNKDKVKIGIEFVHTKTGQRRAERFSLPDSIIYTTFAENPIRSGQISCYTILDISVEGINIKADDIWDMLFPGIQLELHVFLLGKVVHSLKLEVYNIKNTQQHPYQMGCKFLKVDLDFLAKVSEYILCTDSRNFSVETMRKGGFYVAPALSLSLRNKYIREDSEWNEYLKLRLEAQQNEGRWLQETDPFNTIDRFDKMARHIAVYSGNRIVGIGRVVFNNGNLECYEHKNLCKLPDYVINDGFVEVSRFATRPNFRGTYIFLRLIKSAFDVAIQENQRWVVANCEDSLLKIYRRVGAFDAHTSFFTEFMGDKKLNLMIFDIKRISKGYGIKFPVWNMIFSEHFNNGTLKPRWRFWLLKHLSIRLAPVLGFMGNYLSRKKVKRCRDKYLAQLGRGGVVEPLSPAPPIRKTTISN